MDPKLVHKGGAMRLDGPNAYPESCRHFFVAAALGEEPRDFSFARG